MSGLENIFSGVFSPAPTTNPKETTSNSPPILDQILKNAEVHNEQSNTENTKEEPSSEELHNIIRRQVTTRLESIQKNWIMNCDLTKNLALKLKQNEKCLESIQKEMKDHTEILSLLKKKNEKLQNCINELKEEDIVGRVTISSDSAEDVEKEKKEIKQAVKRQLKQQEVDRYNKRLQQQQQSDKQLLCEIMKSIINIFC